MFRLFTFFVEFPALDRLVSYLEAQDQKEIDAAVKRIDDLSARLKAARGNLESQTQKEK